jgi:hypothetical protein
MSLKVTTGFRVTQHISALIAGGRDELDTKSAIQKSEFRPSSDGQGDIEQVTPRTRQQYRPKYPPSEEA